MARRILMTRGYVNLKRISKSLCKSLIHIEIFDPAEEKM